MALHIEPSALGNWEDEGERIAPELDPSSAVLVAGPDDSAAARVALAIARRQARRRRVVLVDAAGELQPIERLLPEGSSHGLVDMLEHGVSPARVAVPVDRAGNLFVVPSGATPLNQAELLSGAAWERFVRFSHDAGALLLVVAPERFARLTSNRELLDGAVLVGDASSAETWAGALPLLAHAHRRERPGEEAPARPASDRAQRTPRAPFLVAIAATVLALAALTWWAVQSSFDGVPTTASVTSAGSVVSGGAGGEPAAGRRRAGAGAIDGAAAGAGAASERSPAAAPAAAAPRGDAAATTVDSAAVVPYGVALAQYNDVTAALTRIAQESARGIPASTYAPFYDTNLRRQVYLVIAGAFHDRDDATSLLRSLRRQRVLAAGQGHVIDAPFAILVHSGLRAEEARAQLDEFRLRGLPVYSLVQSDGTVNIYAGAFRTAPEAGKLLGIVDSAGASPRIAQRAGRPAQ